MSKDVIKRGMLGFSRNRSLLSKLIRWFTRQEWSHTFIILDYDEDVGDHKIIEASTGGVRINSLEKYREDYHVELCELSDHDTELGISAAETLLGSRYGYLQLIGYIPVVLLRRVGIPVNNALTKGVVCSELAAEFLSAVLNDPSWKARANETTPGDIYEAIRALDVAVCTEL